MFTKNKKFWVGLTLAALFALNSLSGYAEIMEDSLTPHGQTGGLSGRFQRIATFPVFLNTDEGTETAAEIVSVSEDGGLLIYTDSPTSNLGFVDIADPRDPKPSGVLAMSASRPLLR